MTSETPAVGSPPQQIEQLRLVTMAQAADALGVAYWQVQRAVRRGDIPSYSPFNSRRLVRLSEVVEFINASRQGGDDE